MMPSRLRSILVACDLSEGSGEVLRAAAALATTAGADLHVIHAFEFPEALYTDEEGVHADFPGRIADAERELERLLRDRLPPHVRVASRGVVIWIAYKAILERAREVGADLIVMGPHRKRPLLDQVLGGTADRVVRHASVPVLIVRGALSLPLRRVVVPVDPADQAPGALEVALSWGVLLGGSSGAARAEVKVKVVRVVPRDSRVTGAEVDAVVEETVLRIDGASELDVRAERLDGRPAEQILRAAEQGDADLIVMGTHGRGVLQRAMVGSVASAVARQARCPVLLVPPELWRGRSDARDLATTQTTRVEARG